MGSVEEQVRDLIKNRYKSVPKLAQAIGVPKQTIYSALRNGLAGASLNTVMPIAEALNLDPFQLAQGNFAFLPNPDANSVEVPLLESIVAGAPIEPEEKDRTFPIPSVLQEQYPGAFLLRVEGESMNRVLPNGCYGLVDPCSEIVESQQIYVLTIGGRTATIKRVVLLDNGLELQPDSTDPTFRSRIFDFGNPDAKTIEVIGRVVWYCLPPTFDPSER